MLLTLLFLVLIALIFLALILSTMGMRASDQQKALTEHVKEGHVANLDEVNQAVNDNLAANATLIVGLMASLILGVIFLTSYQAYQPNKAAFGQWLELTYHVKVDYQRADLWDCYLDILHYPKQASSAVAPHPDSIACNTEGFAQQKHRFGVESAALKLIMMAIGLCIAIQTLIIGFFWRRWFTQPKLAWVKTYAQVKWV